MVKESNKQIIIDCLCDLNKTGQITFAEFTCELKKLFDSLSYDELIKVTLR